MARHKTYPQGASAYAEREHKERAPVDNNRSQSNDVNSVQVVKAGGCTDESVRKGKCKRVSKPWNTPASKGNTADLFSRRACSSVAVVLH